MVFQDLSDRSPGSSNKKTFTGAAPVADRILSVVLDLALFGPLFSLVISGLLKKLQYRYYASPDSTEFWVLLGLIIFSYSILTVVTQGLCWAFWGATPGQFFFQLRVVNHGTRRMPSLQASWLRGFLFWCECALFGVPFLEVFSHPDRRAFHDRAAETEVVTLKTLGMAAPHPVEIRLVRGLFTLCLALMMTWTFAGANRVYRKVVSGAYKEAELTEMDYLCSDVPARVGGRLDAALAMQLVGALSNDCLSTEIDFAFWKGDSEDQAWASFATAVMNAADGNLKEAYVKQACDKGPTSGACRLALWWSKSGGEPPKLKESWTRSVLALQLSDREQDAKTFEKELDSLPGDFDISDYIEVQRIKLFWLQGKKEEARGGYQVVGDHLTSRLQRNLSADLCFWEVTQDCSVRNYPYCRDLESSIAGPAVDSDDLDPRWIQALAEEKFCRKTGDFKLMGWLSDQDPESEWGRLMRATVGESGWGSEKRLEALRHLVSDQKANQAVRGRASVHLKRLEDTRRRPASAEDK